MPAIILGNATKPSRFGHFWQGAQCLAPAMRNDIWTSKNGPYMVCFVHFDLEMCFSPQRRALFRHLNFQKWSAPLVFCTFWLGKCASRYNGVQFFITHLASWLRTRRFSEPTFWPSWTPNHWKNTVFRDFLTFSRICIFFLLTLSLLLFFLLIFLCSPPLPCSAFHLSILSEVWLLNFLRLIIIVVIALLLKMYKTLGVRTTFGSWDVEKVHAVGPLWREAHFQVKMHKAHHVRTIFGGWMSFRVAGARDCAPCQKWAKREGFVAFSTTTTTTLQYFTLHYNYNYNYTFTTFYYTTLHYTTLHSITLNYTKLHYTTLHYTTLHYTTLQFTTLHYTTLHNTTTTTTQLHSTTLHYTKLYSTTLSYTTLHYTTLHYTTLRDLPRFTTLHYPTLPYTPLHYNYSYNYNYTPLHSTTLNYTILHYTTFHYTPLHYTTAHYITLDWMTLHHR